MMMVILERTVILSQIYNIVQELFPLVFLLYDSIELSELTYFHFVVLVGCDDRDLN